MYKYLSGILAITNPTTAILDVNGIGYELNIPLSTFHKLPDADQKVKLYTYLYVREDVLRLYGFFTEEEQQFFVLLISISGLGPKVALSILSTVGVREFKQSVAANDIKSITKIPGIGKKTAERIVLEIKSKLDDLTALQQEPIIAQFKLKNNRAEDVILALVSLGYKQSQAKQSLQRVVDAEKIDDLSVEEVIKKCLAYA